MMLVRFAVAGNLPLTEPPEAWVVRAQKLAKRESLVSSVKSVLARLVFDSWASPQPVGVRGEAAIEQRRVRFEAAPVAVDIRAEHLKTGWSFVAQVTGVDYEQAKLSADRQLFALDEHGICQWSHSKPPKKIAVVTTTQSVELPGIPWKMKPQRKPRGNS